MPEISESERSPLVDALLEVIAWQQKKREELEQQILKLKGETTKPKIKRSTLDKETDPDNHKDNRIEITIKVIYGTLNWHFERGKRY